MVRYWEPNARDDISNSKGHFANEKTHKLKHSTGHCFHLAYDQSSIYSNKGLFSDVPDTKYGCYDASL